jgi:isopentenyl diphosphate isomerase/L-lactate dehydrogenase-like FMN-dependent dehydrogenase
LGATAACGGRAWYWGLAAGGQKGVERILSILSADIDRSLALIGERQFENICSTNLYR